MCRATVLLYVFMRRKRKTGADHSRKGVCAGGQSCAGGAPGAWGKRTVIPSPFPHAAKAMPAKGIMSSDTVRATAMTMATTRMIFFCFKSSTSYDKIMISGTAARCISKSKIATSSHAGVYISVVEKNVETVNKPAVSSLFDKLRQNYGSKNSVAF